MSFFDRAVLLHVMPRAQAAVDVWAGALEQAAGAFGIETPASAAMWLANIAHESLELTKLEEDLHYHPERLLAVFPKYFKTLDEATTYCHFGPGAIASRVYANRLGNGDEHSEDGWNYRGRGPIGITFKDNYRACSLAICGDESTLLTSPQFLSDPEYGAAAAAWYWSYRQCGAAAEAGDFDGVCDLINIGHKTTRLGDSIGFADRQHYLDLANEVIA